MMNQVRIYFINRWSMMLHLWDGKHITILYNFYISIEGIKTIFVFVFIASKLNETLFNRVTTYLFRQNIVAVGCACYIYNTCALSKHIGNMCMTGADPGGCTRRARPLKLKKNMIFGVKSWFFHTKYPKKFRASLHHWKK